MAGKLVFFTFYRRTQYAGAYRIRGTVDELGSGGPYPVWLLNKRHFWPIEARWANAADGTYEIDYLANTPEDFLLISRDYGPDPVNAAISDQPTLEPMP